MRTSRLEAFSDGVLAIVITIMVLEIKIPHGADFQALVRIWPVLLSYLMSFIVVGIYWNNHHHMLAATEKVNGPSLWANHHLLFWLSLVPAATAWLGDTRFAPFPTAVYGFILLMAGVAYFFLAQALIHNDGPCSALAQAVGKDLKGKASVGIYAAGIAASMWLPAAAYLLYISVSVLWLIPDRRIERVLFEES